MYIEPGVPGCRKGSSNLIREGGDRAISTIPTIPTIPTILTILTSTSIITVIAITTVIRT